MSKFVDTFLASLWRYCSQWFVVDEKYDIDWVIVMDIVLADQRCKFFCTTDASVCS